ncbi:MAG TPA: IPExxxVDY family protein, partial [Flavobacteriaceae bacterium]|nr:IPExxxVDY family protein [Flavobacteriaceae bacterium]
KNKRMLSLIEEDGYSLIAVHSSLETYQLAFFLNKFLGLRLKREKQDVDFKHKELLALYPLYHFFDLANERGFYLVSNKFKGNKENFQPSGGLFQEEPIFTTNLIPEYKKVDFFLKIEDETEITDVQNIVRNLNNVPKIITAYALEVEALKSKENLIFN